jgi:hypothetical protein
MFVLICHCGGTCLIRVYIVRAQNNKQAVVWYFNYFELFTSIYNHVQLWSLIYCLLWLI